MRSRGNDVDENDLRRRLTDVESDCLAAAVTTDQNQARETLSQLVRTIERDKLVQAEEHQIRATEVPPFISPGCRT